MCYYYISDNMKDIYIKNDSYFYSNLKKYIKKKGIIVHLLYDKYDIIDDTVLNNHSFTHEDKLKIQTIHAINLKNIKEKYSYIYDTVCDYLDNEFVQKNICGFEDNICQSVKHESHCKESKNGCCYGRNRGLCLNFKDNKCSIKSISCKLFTCRYLKKNKVKYKINDIFLLRYFFNNVQKFIIDTSIFKDKDEMINLLLKYK